MYLCGTSGTVSLNLFHSHLSKVLRVLTAKDVIALGGVRPAGGWDRCTSVSPKHLTGRSSAPPSTPWMYT